MSASSLLNQQSYPPPHLADSCFSQSHLRKATNPPQDQALHISPDRSPSASNAYHTYRVPCSTVHSHRSVDVCSRLHWQLVSKIRLHPGQRSVLSCRWVADHKGSDETVTCPVPVSTSPVAPMSYTPREMSFGLVAAPASELLSAPSPSPGLGLDGMRFCFPASLGIEVPSLAMLRRSPPSRGSCAMVNVGSCFSE